MVAPRRKRGIQTENIDLSSIFREMGEALINVETRPTLLQYEPHDKQKLFHCSQSPERLFIGGNRTGKTVSGAVEAIWWLTKKHPYRELPDGPIRGRVITVDLTEGLEQIIIPMMKQWLPAGDLINGSWEQSYNKGLRVLTLANGSTCDFLTYEQDPEKHAGTSRHFVWFDEEPSQEIFTENMLRLLDTDGSYWITMTPLFGMTWVYDDIYLPGKQGDEHIFVVEVETDDNPHIQEKAKSRILGRLSKDARTARQEGKFVELGGLVFKTFDKSKHVISKETDPLLSNGVPNRNWKWYMSLDSGWNNPTAIYWHAVSPQGLVITFGEHYASEMTVPQHVEVIKLRETMWHRVADIRTGDPATKQTRESTGTSVQGEYALRGIYLALDGVPTGPGSVHVGITRMQEYIKNNWLIVDDCPNLIHELERLHWKTYQSKKVASRQNPQEEVAKKNDHGFDACRYFFTLMPELSPDSLPELRREIKEGSGHMRYDEMLVKMQQELESPDRVDFGQGNQEPELNLDFYRPVPDTTWTVDADW